VLVVICIASFATMEEEAEEEGGGRDGARTKQRLRSRLNLNLKEVCVAEIQPFSGSVERRYAPKGRDHKMWTVMIIGTIGRCGTLP